jgi:hypothetical protein
MPRILLTARFIVSAAIVSMVVTNAAAEFNSPALRLCIELFGDALGPQ